MSDTYICSLDIPEDWQPTAKNINNLPGPLKDYIHHLETSHGAYADVIHDAYISELNYRCLLRRCGGK